MPMTFLSETGDHRKIPALCRMVDGADCYILRNGDLGEAVEAFKELLLER